MAQGMKKPVAAASPVAAARPKRKGSTGTVVGALVVVALLIFFFIKVLPGPKQELGDAPKEAPAAPIAAKPVQLSPKPQRLYRDAIKAIMALDRKEMLALCNIPGNPFEEVLTQERADAMALSYPQKRYRMSEEKIEGTKARYAIIFKNARGQDVEELAFDMEQQGSDTETWKIVKIWNRWGPGSAHKQEGGLAALGPARVPVPYVPRAEPTKQTYFEVEPVEQPYPEGTADSLKAEIERNMKLVLDKDHPAAGNVANMALIAIGKPAIPALLNAMMRLNPRNDDDDRLAFVIDRVLWTMTDREMGYPSGGIVVVDVPPAQAKVRAVRRWFGWWQQNKALPINPRSSLPEKEDK